MLTGSDLLAKVKELGDASKSDLVRSCGYVSTKKDGGERLNFTAFYEALLEAKGLSLGNDGVGRGKGGRKLSYTATAQTADDSTSHASGPQAQTAGSPSPSHRIRNRCSIERRSLERSHANDAKHLVDKICDDPAQSATSTDDKCIPVG